MDKTIRALKALLKEPKIKREEIPDKEKPKEEVKKKDKTKSKTKTKQPVKKEFKIIVERYPSPISIC